MDRGWLTSAGLLRNLATSRGPHDLIPFVQGCLKLCATTDFGLPHDRVIELGARREF